MKTTEENNRLIAEFMGITQDKNGKYKIIEDFDIVENIQTYTVDDGIRVVEGGYVITKFLPDEMRYHTSWDWLMPVVAKITRDEELIDNEYRESILDVVGYGHIDDTYSLVIEFIEWYNEQNKFKSMKTYKDTGKEIQEGNRYFAVSDEVLPIVKREDKYYAQIIMSCFDEQSEEEDCLMFEYLENAIRHCCEDNFYTGVSYSDYRINNILFITK